MKRIGMVLAFAFGCEPVTVYCDCPSADVNCEPKVFQLDGCGRYDGTCPRGTTIRREPALP